MKRKASDHAEEGEKQFASPIVDRMPPRPVQRTAEIAKKRYACDLALALNPSPPPFSMFSPFPSPASSASPLSTPTRPNAKRPSLSVSVPPSPSISPSTTHAMMDDAFPALKEKGYHIVKFLKSSLYGCVMLCSISNPATAAKSNTNNNAIANANANSLSTPTSPLISTTSAPIPRVSVDSSASSSSSSLVCVKISRLWLARQMQTAGLDGRLSCTRDHVLAEASMIRLADSAHVVKLVDEFQTDSCHYLVTSFAGPELFDVCQSRQIIAEQARNYFKQVTQAVQHMHANGIAHLDLSLSNLCVDEKLGVVRVIDFGAADNGAELSPPVATLAGLLCAPISPSCQSSASVSEFASTLRLQTPLPALANVVSFSLDSSATPSSFACSNFASPAPSNISSPAMPITPSHDSPAAPSFPPSFQLDTTPCRRIVDFSSPPHVRNANPMTNTPGTTLLPFKNAVSSMAVAVPIAITLNASAAPAAAASVSTPALTTVTTVAASDTPGASVATSAVVSPATVCATTTTVASATISTSYDWPHSVLSARARCDMPPTKMSHQSPEQRACAAFLDRMSDSDKPCSFMGPIRLRRICSRRNLVRDEHWPEVEPLMASSTNQQAVKWHDSLPTCLA